MNKSFLNALNELLTYKTPAKAQELAKARRMVEATEDLEAELLYAVDEYLTYQTAGKLNALAKAKRNYAANPEVAGCHCCVQTVAKAVPDLTGVE